MPSSDDSQDVSKPLVGIRSDEGSLIGRALRLREAGDFTGAIAPLRQAWELHRDIAPLAGIDLGLAYERAGELSRAVENAPEVRVVLARAQAKLGSEGEARKNYEAAHLQREFILRLGGRQIAERRLQLTETLMSERCPRSVRTGGSIMEDAARSFGFTGGK